MYNRYTPQSDGTFHKNRIPDQSIPPPPPEPIPPPCPPAPEPDRPHRKETPQGSFGIGSFLRSILPRNFDTGDLIVVLLLLLMAADGQEDQNTALLTLALYLFL